MRQEHGKKNHGLIWGSTPKLTSKD